MPDVLLRILFRPVTWVGLAGGLLIADLLAPPGSSLYVLSLGLLFVSWRLLHRRYVARLTALWMLAVSVPGFVHATRQPSSPSVETEHRAVAEPWSGGLPLEPARLWTLAGLAAAGWFHTNLQRDRRRRLRLRQDLQRRVRRRTNQVHRANRALRNEVARRQETEHLLDRSEHRFNALMDRMQLQVARKNCDGIIIYANEPFCRNLGVTAAEVIGRTDADLFPPDLAIAYRRGDLRVMQTGQAVDQVERHPGPHGNPGYVQVFKAPEYDQEGHCMGVQVVFWDVTERHRSEVALRDSEARKRAVFEAAGDAMLLVDAGGTIVEANPSAAELFRLPTGALVGKPLDQIAVPAGMPADETRHAPPTSADPRDGSSADPRDGSHPWRDLVRGTRHEMRLARADGTSFDAEVSVHAIPVGGDPGLAIIVRDVTVRRRAFQTLREAKAAAEAANRTKTEFMAGVSHELRTPLGGITGLAELLAGSDLSPRDREYVTLIRHSASMLSEVIEDVLDFAAIEAGRLQVNPTPIDLYQVVAEAFQCVGSRAAEKPVRLILSIDPETPRHVIGDAKRIRQIITNLAGNAIKFTPKGEVALRLLPDRSAGGERVVIEVRDTGIGVAPADRERIFEAFERGEQGTNRYFGGTGLGLAISRILARRMGGDITVMSRPGGGSSFRCSLSLPEDSDRGRRDRGRVAGLPRPAGLGGPASRGGQTLVLVDTGCPALDESLVSQAVGPEFRGIPADRIRHALSERPPYGQRNPGPRIWVWSPGRETQWIGETTAQDRVVWVTRIGESVPSCGPENRCGPENAPVLIEPVIPDDWIAALRGGTSPGPSRPLAGRRQKPHLAPSRRKGGGHLLVVDDSEVNRVVIRDLLVREGFRVEVAVDGEQAMRMVTGGADDATRGPAAASVAHYDCILMDLQMPGIDGAEAAVRIRGALRHAGRDVPPIIALTAHVTEDYRQLCQRAGMDGFLTKPIAPQRLIAEVRLRMSGSHAPGEPAQAVREETVEDEATEGGAWRERLASHGGNQAEVIASLCDAFLSEVPALGKRLRSAVQSGDAKRLKTAAHTLKSCLRYVAEPEDVAVAASIEAAAENPGEISAGQLEAIDRIAARWIRRVQAYRNELIG